MEEFNNVPLEHTNKEYQGVCNISERTATRDLSNLVSLGLFMQIGVTGKGTEYILTRQKEQRRHKDAIRPIYPSPLVGEPACRSLGEGRGRGEREAGFIPHFRKGGQGGILEESDSKLCCALIYCLPAGRQGGGLGQVECLGRGRPLAGKGVIPLKEGKGEGNFVMNLLLNPIKDPARLGWHEVKKVDHYYLSIDAVTQPMQVREGEAPYGDGKK